MRTPGKMPGARGVVTGSSLGSDAPQSTPSPCKLQARPVGGRGRARFARSAVFEMFGYRFARAIDYDRFRDRHPRQPPRPSPEVWRMANGRARP